MATSSIPGPAATSGAEMMKTVKAECDKAPAGPKKDAALKHYAKDQVRKQVDDWYTTQRW